MGSDEFVNRETTVFSNLDASKQLPARRSSRWESTLGSRVTTLDGGRFFATRFLRVSERRTMGRPATGGPIAPSTKGFV